jgi:hypothetical protein
MCYYFTSRWFKIIIIIIKSSCFHDLHKEKNTYGEWHTLGIFEELGTIFINMIHHPKFHAKIPHGPNSFLKYIKKLSYFS